MKDAQKSCVIAQTDTPDSRQQLRLENERLREHNDALQRRITWFEKQLFGRKSEKRLIEPPAEQGALPLNCRGEAMEPVKDQVTIPAYQRGKAKKKRPEDCATDAGLRFNDNVPVEVITLTAPELSGSDADQYEIIDTKVSYKLAQRPASYVVLQYERPVFKKKDTQTIQTTPMLPQVLDNSLADVSLLVGLLIDKFLYHLPLYRQHQRLQHAGVTLARATLTNLVKRAIELLRPIVDAQLAHILLSKVLAMDETPIKAGQQGRGKLKQAWFWPIYGEDDEIVFTYSNTRSRRHIETVLKKQFEGTLLSDGHSAYACYARQMERVTHAQCWTHTRRQYIEAESSSPEAVTHALDAIGVLYKIEDTIKEKSLDGEKKRHYRLEHSKPVVDDLFEWCENQLNKPDLTPKHPLRAAINYTLRRKDELRVFLEDPDVPLDTNHLERALRVIPMGRKNWLFCWTELGAEHVGVIQSLITTCKLQGVDPFVYLTDVLQRLSIHPARKVEELTPRVWKETFADSPMTSILSAKRQ